MKNFLAKEQVKQYFYQAIFDKVDGKDIFKKKNKKEIVKIFADDIKTQKEN